MVAAWEKKFHTLPKLEDNLQINFTELTFSGMKSDDEGGQKGGQKSGQKSGQKGGQKSGQKSGQKGGQKGGQKSGQTTEQVLELIKANPNITRAELSSALDISPSAIQKHIDKLKGTRIRRIGPDKGGHWEIIVPEG